MQTTSIDFVRDIKRNCITVCSKVDNFITELREMSGKVMEEIAFDVFIAEPDKEIDRQIAHEHLQDFGNFEDVELVVMEEWVDVYTEAMFLAESMKECRALMPSRKDFQLYYSLRGDRPSFVKPNVCYWHVLHYVPFERQKAESARVTREIRDIVDRYSFKPTRLGFEVPVEIGAELRDRNVPYSSFCGYVTRHRVIPTSITRAVTELLKAFREKKGCWPSDAEECMEVFDDISDYSRHIFDNYRNARYHLELRIGNYWVPKLGGLLNA